MAGDNERRISGPRNVYIGLYLGIFLMTSINEIETSSSRPTTACAPRIHKPK